MTRHFLVAVFVLLAVPSYAADPAQAESPTQPQVADMKALAEALGAKPGQTTGRVHAITLPRSDLDVYTPDIGEIPVEAGLATDLRLWRCACGSYYIVGSFCVADYESNDVIDALRAGGLITITSVAPMLHQEKQRVLLIRFQGGAKIEQLTKILKEAVRWTGANRSQKNPVK